LLPQSDPPPKSFFKNPLLYSWGTLSIAALAVVWILFSRWWEDRSIEYRAREARSEKQRQQDRVPLWSSPQGANAGSDKKKGGYTSRPNPNRDEIPPQPKVTSFPPRAFLQARQVAPAPVALASAKRRTCLP
jgi:hypothetical protein